MSDKPGEEMQTDGREKQNKAPLADAVADFRADHRISFHVPGHKSRSGSRFFSDFYGRSCLKHDLTELPGLDDLHNPKEVILEAQQLAADLFGAEQTFFLVNGSTSGIIASLAAVSEEKDTVILERNSHECTTRGLVLSGAAPYYLYNHFDEDTGIPAGISVEEAEKALEICRSPAAVLLTHPSYYGTYSDLRRIAELAHAAGAAVIVDEAHGAQMAFTGQEIPSALEAGADIVVQSTHKMLGSLTQSSMLHVQGDLADRNRLRYYTGFMNSSSPSYLLMSSLDLTRKRMAAEGDALWRKNAALVKETGAILRGMDGIECPSSFRGKDGKEHELESSRLLISAWERGITGPQLSDLLSEQYGIDAEFSDLRYTVILAGSESVESDFRKLIRAMEEISRLPASEPDPQVQDLLYRSSAVLRFRPAREMTPRKAVTAGKLLLPGKTARNAVSARDISVYPPGVPVIRAGEVFTDEIIDFIEEGCLCGMVFHGMPEAGEDGALRFVCAEDARDLRMLEGFF